MEDAYVMIHHIGSNAVQDASENLSNRQNDKVLITGEMGPANKADTLIDHNESNAVQDAYKNKLIDHTKSNAVQNAVKFPHTNEKSPLIRKIQANMVCSTSSSPASSCSTPYFHTSTISQLL